VVIGILAFSGLALGGHRITILLVVFIAFFVFGQYSLLVDRERTKGAESRRFDMPAYEKLPEGERYKALTLDLLAEPWVVRSHKRQRIDKEQVFLQEFEARGGARFRVGGEVGADRFRPTFELPRSALGLKGKVERFAEEHGWEPPHPREGNE